MEPLQGLWLFAPNRDTQGGSAWWLEAQAQPQAEGEAGGLLIDCPALSEANLAFLRAQAAGTLVLTGRQGHGKVLRWQQALGWPVLVQEQEAYLLPGVERLQSFGAEHRLSGGGALLWTPGPSPGACVLHAQAAGQGVLFCGRLLLPVGPASLAPLRTRSTFHWQRQLLSLERLRLWLAASAGSAPIWLASGAGLGALRGGKLGPDALQQLQSLDLEQVRYQAATADF
ncbi:MAG: MBL fold metallo-hydrolase [Prochlorococcaceae cyanobacterium]